MVITPPTRRVWRSFKFAPFLFFFPCRKSGYRSWVIPLCSIPNAIWDSEPISTRLLNSISSRICRQNTQFNMYTTTSKQQEGCTFKDSHPKCFITTNFDKFHREAFARGGESLWCFDSMFPRYTKSKVNSNGVCNYDFVRREGLSLAIWFDIRCKTTTYQRSYLNRTTRLWNILPKELTGINISLTQFKSGLYKYYQLAVKNVFDVDDPRTWKSICLSCNKCRNLSCEISCCY